jgi:prepilin-type processing-associated H-X9-DG protein
MGEMNYGLRNHLWGGCKPSGTVKWGETRWAVGYPGVTWASTVSRLNPDTIVTYIPPGLPAEYEAFRSDHPGGVNFLFVDGSAHFIANAIELTTLKALATRAGSEKIDRFD